MNTNEQMDHNLNAVTSSAEALFELGMKYCVAHSYVEAHKWFNIAALKGNESAKYYRCDIAREMSPQDIAEAQRQARSLLTLH
jgi:uncharacterized protein